MTPDDLPHQVRAEIYALNRLMRRREQLRFEQYVKVKKLSKERAHAMRLLAKERSRTPSPSCRLPSQFVFDESICKSRLAQLLGAVTGADEIAEHERVEAVAEAVEHLIASVEIASLLEEEVLARVDTAIDAAAGAGAASETEIGLAPSWAHSSPATAVGPRRHAWQSVSGASAAGAPPHVSGYQPAAVQAATLASSAGQRWTGWHELGTDAPALAASTMPAASADAMVALRLPSFGRAGTAPDMASPLAGAAIGAMSARVRLEIESTLARSSRDRLEIESTLHQSRNFFRAATGGATPQLHGSSALPPGFFERAAVYGAMTGALTSRSNFDRQYVESSVLRHERRPPTNATVTNATAPDLSSMSSSTMSSSRSAVVPMGASPALTASAFGPSRRYHREDEAPTQALPSSSALPPSASPVLAQTGSLPTPSVHGPKRAPLNIHELMHTKLAKMSLEGPLLQTTGSERLAKMSSLLATAASAEEVEEAAPGVSSSPEIGKRTAAAATAAAATTTTTILIAHLVG